MNGAEPGLRGHRSPSGPFTRSNYRLFRSDIGQKVEVFIIFILSTLAGSEFLLRADKFNAFDPLDHLVAKLILYAQPQWSTVNVRKWLPVHVRGEKALGLDEIVDGLRFVIRAAVE